MNVAVDQKRTMAPENWDRRGLPAWTYRSAAMLELEKREIFHTHWQIAGHISDLPEPGDYLALDIGEERALVVKGEDGVIRAFNNLCRHRGARVVADTHGHCKNALVCPFHGWVYNLDGTLRGPARPKSFGDLDRSQFGLKPIEIEIWLGFIFIRFRPGPQPPVAELLALYLPDLRDYGIEHLVPASGFQLSEVPVNWKSVRDVDNEGYHVPMAHPGLQDLYGADYRDFTYANGLSASKAQYNAHAGRRWSVRNYVKIAPKAEWLPEGKRRMWAYYGVFPNGVISVTPEVVQFYQEFPVSTNKTVVRGATYRRREEDRRLRAARYLAARIDRETFREDQQLTIWSNEAMKSEAFEGFHLSDLEYGVRNHHDQLRRLLPVMTVDQAPAEARLHELNAEIRAKLAGSTVSPQLERENR
jgi:phenylpropionate dioxygenase-like ring-hydroxylating dioxygenase large terminal subunit